MPFNNAIPRLFHVTSRQLHKNKDHRENIKGINWENIKFLSSLYEIQIQVNNKIIVCVITYRPESTWYHLRDAGPPTS